MTSSLVRGSAGQGDVLRTLVAAARRAADERARRSAAVSGRRSQRSGVFAEALRGSASSIRLIAECKRRSPSRGVLRAAYDPVAIARSYEAHGAAAVSVLTEPTFFDGSLDDLRAARAAVSLPLLRKDFIVTPFQIDEAGACGADAVLLIVAALETAALRELLQHAAACGIDALVEVHDRVELDAALDAGATIVGVNSRDLRTLEMNPGVFEALAPHLPDGVIAVAESGLSTPEDLVRLRRVRYDAFLIGERFMTAADPGDALGGLLEASSRVIS